MNLATIEALVPHHLPSTTTGPPETGLRESVTLRLSNGRTLVYGPKLMPPGIQRVRAELLKRYGQREDRLMTQRRQKQLLEQAKQNRPVHPVTGTPDIVGGTPEQRRVLASLVRQVPLPGTAQIRVQGSLLDLIPPTGHGTVHNQAWTAVANGWGGNAIVSAYNRIAAQRHLPALRTVRPDYQGDRAGAPIPLTQPAKPYPPSKLRRYIYAKARAQHLTIVRLALVDLGGWNAYVEARTPSPKHLSSLNFDIPNGGRTPGFSSTLTLIDNPCGTPISVYENAIWSGNDSGSAWQDPAWSSPSSMAPPPPGMGQLHALSPSNPCF